MNLRQLINSTKKTVSNMFDTSKDFTQKALGQVISVNTDEHYDNVRGLRHMVMYITSVTQKTSTIQLYDKRDRRKKEIYKEPKRKISTHTVGISFSGYYRLDIPLQELEDDDNINLWQEGLTPKNQLLLAKSGGKYLYGRKQSKYNYREIASRYDRDEFYEDMKTSWEDLTEIGKGKLDKSTPEQERYLRKYAPLVEAELRRRIDNYLRKKNVNQELKKDYIIRKDSVLNGKIKINYEKKNDQFGGYHGVITIETPLSLTNVVRVRCTCAHFYYTYAWYNADHRALIGEKPAPYIRVNTGWAKKASGIVTERNLNKVPGLCKHLQFFVSYLIQEGIIQETQNSRTFNLVSPKKNDEVREKLNNTRLESAKLSKSDRAKLEAIAKEEATMQRHDMELSRREADIYANPKKDKGGSKK